MAIQFHCPGCSQPIEVDDIHAGQTAACPYCRQVVNVPTESSLGQAPPVSARPAAEVDSAGSSEAPDGREAFGPRTFPQQQPPGELHIGPTMTHREQAARTYANYALICTAIAVVLMIATMIYGAALMADRLNTAGSSQPSLDKISQELALEHRSLAVGPLGAMFFAVVGLALGIASIKQTTRGNWRGITAVVACGLFVLCFCGINALGLLAGGLAALA
jgi:hypothetical protein